MIQIISPQTQAATVSTALLEQQTNEIEPKLGAIEAASNATTNAVNALANALAQPQQYNANTIHEVKDFDSNSFVGHSVTVVVMEGSVRLDMAGATVENVGPGSFSYEATAILENKITVSGESAGTKAIILILQ